MLLGVSRGCSWRCDVGAISGVVGASGVARCNLLLEVSKEVH